MIHRPQRYEHHRGEQEEYHRRPREDNYQSRGDTRGKSLNQYKFIIQYVPLQHVIGTLLILFIGYGRYNQYEDRAPKRRVYEENREYRERCVLL